MSQCELWLICEIETEAMQSEHWLAILWYRHLLTIWCGRQPMIRYTRSTAYTHLLAVNDVMSNKIQTSTIDNEAKSVQNIHIWQWHRTIDIISFEKLLIGGIYVRRCILVSKCTESELQLWFCCAKMRCRWRYYFFHFHSFHAPIKVSTNVRFGR